jgi:hypothetical protein
MAQLTDLEMRDWQRPFAEDAAIIGRLVQLRSLRLTAIDNMAKAFAHFPVGSPMLAQLRHLSVGDFDAHDGSADYAALLRRLAHMESLRLIRARGIDVLLDSLHHAPALRTLIVECSPEHSSQAERSTHPSHVDVQSLLGAAPLLQVQLQMSPLEGWQAATRALPDHLGRMDPRVAEEQRAGLQRLVADLRPRVTLLTVE